MNVTAVLSMLHEPHDRNSAARLFRSKPVLRWTLDRLARCRGIGQVTIICWEDQLDQVMPIAAHAHVLAKGPRVRLPEIESVAAARRWSDGWRGGLLSTSAFDRGFFGPWVQETLATLNSDAAMLIDPSSALIDGALVDGLIDHASARPDLEIAFTPAAQGLGAILLRRALLERLAAARVHPGRLLHYLPDQLSREPLAGESCAPTPTAVARSTDRFTLDSDRQVTRVGQATVSLNGQLIATGSEALVRRLQSADLIDEMPREVVIELNTRRATNPLYWIGRHQQIDRPEMDLATARRVIDELAQVDDLRLTIAGVGDPLLAASFDAILEAAAEAGIHAVHVETDLLGVKPEQVEALAQANVDVVSVHLPALTAQVYERVAGINAYTQVLQNIQTFVTERQRRRGRMPILVPTFTKCRDNAGEMEGWYDQWLRAVGSAVVRGPSTFGGLMPDVGVADMAPPRRRSCARLWSRLTILSDGRIVSCEEDVLGRQVLGTVGDQSIRDAWSRAAGALRGHHSAGSWDAAPLCKLCKEWHRP